MTTPEGRAGQTLPVDPDASAEGLLESLEEGVVRISGSKIVEANAALARMAGRPAHALDGIPLRELFSSAEGRPADALATGEAWRLRNARGELVPISLRRVCAELFVVVDRSRERRLEREIWRLSGELRRAGRPEPGFPAHEEVLGMIEHEIRTATTVIRGYTRMLLDERSGPINPQQRGYLVEARRGTERISALLDNLLELASLECQPGLRVARRSVGLNEVVEAAAAQARPLLDERGLRLELRLDAVPDALSADPARLQQVLLNLLANAAKFAPEGTVVRVETACAPGQDALEVRVIDAGPGVVADEAKRIFRPFVRGRAAAASGAAGVGLGLSICQRIVEAHGGAIEAVADTGHGIFRVRLPRAEA
jgi:signal transduction histidine kinase